MKKLILMVCILVMCILANAQKAQWFLYTSGWWCDRTRFTNVTFDNDYHMYTIRNKDMCFNDDTLPASYTLIKQKMDGSYVAEREIKWTKQKKNIKAKKIFLEVDHDQQAYVGIGSRLFKYDSGLKLVMHASEVRTGYTAMEVGGEKIELFYSDGIMRLYNKNSGNRDLTKQVCNYSPIVCAADNKRFLAGTLNGVLTITVLNKYYSITDTFTIPTPFPVNSVSILSNNNWLMLAANDGLQTYIAKCTFSGNVFYNYTTTGKFRLTDLDVNDYLLVNANKKEIILNGTHYSHPNPDVFINDATLVYSSTTLSLNSTTYPLAACFGFKTGQYGFYDSYLYNFSVYNNQLISEDSIHHPYYGFGYAQNYWEYNAVYGNKSGNNRVVATADGSNGADIDSWHGFLISLYYNNLPIQPRSSISNTTTESVYLFQNHLRFNSNENIISASIYDVIGAAKIYSSDISVDKSIDISMLAAGIYIVQYQTASGYSSLKFVIPARE
ncbi:MAG: T9SS type A sorting domain-containing protein [Bacteroidetes bacterium]|nr:T9SS type A sorting domain-containing protein [Bacteroidota bacterium]